MNFPGFASTPRPPYYAVIFSSRRNGRGEEDYAAGKILVTSPLAQGLVGRKPGDRVEIQVPMGTMRFEIIEIRFDGA